MDIILWLQALFVVWAFIMLVYILHVTECEAKNISAAVTKISTSKNISTAAKKISTAKISTAKTNAATTKDQYSSKYQYTNKLKTRWRG